MNFITLSLQETRAARQDRVGSGLPPARQDHVGSGATAKPKSSSADRWKRCVQKLMEATGCQVGPSLCSATWEWALL